MIIQIFVVIIFLPGLDALVSSHGQAATGTCHKSFTEKTRQEVVDDALAAMNCDSLECGKFIKLHQLYHTCTNSTKFCFLQCSFVQNSSRNQPLAATFLRSDLRYDTKRSLWLLLASICQWFCSSCVL